MCGPSCPLASAIPPHPSLRMDPQESQVQRRLIQLLMPSNKIQIRSVYPVPKPTPLPCHPLQVYHGASVMISKQAHIALPSPSSKQFPQDSPSLLHAPHWPLFFLLLPHPVSRSLTWKGMAPAPPDQRLFRLQRGFPGQFDTPFLSLPTEGTKATVGLVTR